MAAPPPDAPPPPQFVTDTQQVSDANVLSGIIINAVFGGLMFIGFVVAQTLNKKLYRFRTISESVSLRPPDWPTTGRNLRKYYLWAVYTWRATDLDILMSCGLDAFFMTKIPVLGLQIFVPFAIISVGVLMPIHINGGFLEENASSTGTSSSNFVPPSSLSFLTISNMPPKSPLLWVHVCVVIGFTFHALFVLYYHFLQIARLRLRYLSRGDDLSFFAEILQDKIRVTQKRLAHAQAPGHAPLNPRMLEARKRALAALERRLMHLERVMRGVQQRISDLEHLRATSHGPRLDLLDEDPHGPGAPDGKGAKQGPGGGDATDSTSSGGGSSPRKHPDLYAASKDKPVNHMHHIVSVGGEEGGAGGTTAVVLTSGHQQQQRGGSGRAAPGAAGPVGEGLVEDAGGVFEGLGGDAPAPPRERLHEAPPPAAGAGRHGLLDMPVLGAAWERKPPAMPWWQHRQAAPSQAAGGSSRAAAPLSLHFTPGSRGRAVPVAQALGEGVEDRPPAAAPPSTSQPRQQQQQQQLRDGSVARLQLGAAAPSASSSERLLPGPPQQRGASAAGGPAASSYSSSTVDVARDVGLLPQDADASAPRSSTPGLPQRTVPATLAAAAAVATVTAQRPESAPLTPPGTRTPTPDGGASTPPPRASQPPAVQAMLTVATGAAAAAAAEPEVVVDPILGVPQEAPGGAEPGAGAGPVAGAGKLGASKVDILKETMPIMFLERPSARYQSSILVPVLEPPPDTDPLLLSNALSAQSGIQAAPSASRPLPPAGATVLNPTAASPPSRTAGGGAALERVGSGEPPAAPQPQRALFAHHGRAYVGALDDLPWGDPEHTGRPHLHAVQVERYAVLVTDVPVPPFVPPVWRDPENDPKVQRAKRRARRAQRRQQACSACLPGGCSCGAGDADGDDAAGAGGERLPSRSTRSVLASWGSSTAREPGAAMSEDRQLGNVTGRQQVEARKLGKDAGWVQRWATALKGALFPSYGTVAELLDDFQVHAGADDEDDHRDGDGDKNYAPRRSVLLDDDDDDGVGANALPPGGGELAVEAAGTEEAEQAARPGAVVRWATGTRDGDGSGGGAFGRALSRRTAVPAADVEMAYEAFAHVTAAQAAVAGRRQSRQGLAAAGSTAGSVAGAAPSAPATPTKLGTGMFNSGLLQLGAAGGAAGPAASRRFATAGTLSRRRRSSGASAHARAAGNDAVASAGGFSTLTAPSQTASYARAADAAVAAPPRVRRPSQEQPLQPFPEEANPSATTLQRGASAAAAPAQQQEAKQEEEEDEKARRHRLLHTTLAVEAARALRARSRGWELWARAREAVRSGRVAELPRSVAYDPVSAMFSTLFPADFDRAMPILSYHKVHRMLRHWNWNMISLDTALTIRERLGKEAKQPDGCGGLMRCHFVNSVDYLTDVVYDLQCNIVRERRKALLGEDGGTGCYIVLFKSQAAASLAASRVTALSENKSQFMVHPAPSPNDINWQVLTVPWDSRRWRWWAMIIPKAFMVLFPITAFSAMFTQLDYVFCPPSVYAPPPPEFSPPAPPSSGSDEPWSWPWYCEQQTFFSRLFKSLVIGWAPSWILATYTGMILPNAFHGLCQKSATNLRLTELDKDVCNLYFWFNVINTFLCGVLGGSFAQQIHSVISSQGLRGTFNLIGLALPSASNFYINYMAHKTLFGWPNKLVIPNGGVVLFCFKKILRWYRVWSVREKAFSLYTCRSPRYGPEIGNLMMPFVVASAFALVSPLVPLVAVFFFAFGWLVWRYLLLFLNVRKYEGGGHYIHFVFERILGCLAIMVCFTAAVLATKEAFAQFYVVLFSMPFVIIYVGWYARRRFGPMLGGNLPLEVAAAAPRVEEFNPDIYNHPALHPQAIGWHPDLHLVWGGIGIWGQL